MKYGSVCSGIESASMAWEPLGMQASWFAEIEAFPSAVLDHHWPEVPNLGDMCNLPSLIAAGLIEAPDILVGGTPCQSFSVAGKRKGLKDKRGQLTLKFVELANEIDKQRTGEECIVVWENVPGVLSSKDNAFGCFLGELVGEECELKPAGKKWSYAGCVYGPQRTVAWRILDAQYFGVAQRRRRVFVVAGARKGFDPQKVLFESEGVRRDTPPSRKEKTKITGDAETGIGKAANLIMAHGQAGAEINENLSPTLSCNHEAPILTLPIHDKTTRHAGKTGIGSGNGLGVGKPEDPAHTLTTGDNHAVFFHQNSRNELRETSLSGALSTGSGKPGQGYSAIRQNDVVRRLMPVECERLQGFPGGHTLIGWGGKKPDDCPDGRRYKAVGNSKAVPVIRWLGERICKHVNNQL